MAAARVTYPMALQGLDRDQMKQHIKRAKLGRTDRKIALMRYDAQECLADIGAATGYTRQAVAYRLSIIDNTL